MAQRVGAVLLAFGIAGVSGFAALIGTVFGFSLKCDDSCAGSPSRWGDDEEAWQWEAFGAVSLVGLACALVFLACITLGRRWLAVAMLVIWAALAAWFLILFDESGLTSHAGRGWAAISALVLAGLAAAALTRPSAPRERARAA